MSQIAGPAVVAGGQENMSLSAHAQTVSDSTATQAPDSTALNNAGALTPPAEGT